MITLILFIAVISILILVHEWGHFYFARRYGVKVEEFSIGFGPPFFSWVRDGVKYSIRSLPFGGFVKMFGEQGEGAGDPKSFISKPAWQRFVILSAGVFMNLVLAWFFFSASSAIGTPQLTEGREDVPISVIAVSPGSPAEKTGLRLGDKIIGLRKGVESVEVRNQEDITEFVNAFLGEEIVLIVQRNSETKELSAVPRKEVPENEGPLGIALGQLITERTPLALAPVEGAKSLVRSIGMTYYGLANILADIFRGRPDVPVSGPLGIYFLSEDIRVLGFSFFLYFVALLSVNLAILNYLPIPVLDGGWVLFLLIEKIRGKQVEERLKNASMLVGFLLLGSLMLFATYQDILRNGERIMEGLRGIF